MYLEASWSRLETVKFMPYTTWENSKIDAIQASLMSNAVQQQRISMSCWKRLSRRCGASHRSSRHAFDLGRDHRHSMSKVVLREKGLILLIWRKAFPLSRQKLIYLGAVALAFQQPEDHGLKWRTRRFPLSPIGVLCLTKTNNFYFFQIKPNTIPRSSLWSLIRLCWLSPL